MYQCICFAAVLVEGVRMCASACTCMWACKWTPPRSYAVTFSAWHEKLAWHIQHSTIWPPSPTMVQSLFSKPRIFISNWLENNKLFLFNVVSLKLVKSHEFSAKAEILNRLNSFVLQLLSHWASFSLLELWHFDNTWQRQSPLPGSKSIFSKIEIVLVSSNLAQRSPGI